MRSFQVRRGAAPEMRAAANRLDRLVANRPPLRAKGGAVLVFTAELLPYSETFVRDHVASLSQRDAVLVGAKQVSGLSTDGIETALLPDSHWSRMLLWILGLSPAMDRLVERHRITLIHAHFADAGARLSRYAARRRLPLIVTLHGADVLRGPGGSAGSLISRLLRGRMMRSTTMFLPVSDYLMKKAVEQGFPPDKLRRHYLGIPLLPPSPARPGSGQPTILFIGRIVEKKGLSYLLEACTILARQGHDFRLRIIGEGPLLEASRAGAEPIAERTTFLGRLSRERVREELGCAHILCMPSVEAVDGDNEGLPIVALEAQSAGLPVVAFDQGPVPESIQANVTGLLAKDRDPEDLAALLERLLVDRSLRRSLGQEGRRYVAQNFDVERQSEELELIYEGVLERARDGGGQE